MTSPTNQTKRTFNTLQPTSSLIAQADRSTQLSTRLAARQFQQWQEELEFMQKENEQILLLYELHLDHKCQSAKTTVETLEEILKNQLPPLLNQINQMKAWLYERGMQQASSDAKNNYVDLQEQLRELKVNVRPLKYRILELMVDTLPVTIM